MRCLLGGLFFVLVLSPCLQAQDWPQWRGPTGDNHAAAGVSVPVTWGENSNLAWVVPVPGRGHASPTVVGDRIYLATADAQQQTQSLLIYNRHTGEKLAEQVAHRGGLTAKMHSNNTFASSTVAVEGQRVFALFHNDGAAWVTAFDLDGNQAWQQRAIGFAPQVYEFGFGSSPVVINGNVVVASEYDGEESGIVALDAATGQQRWKADRPQSLSYSTPALAAQGGQRYLITILLPPTIRSMANSCGPRQERPTPPAAPWSGTRNLVWRSPVEAIPTLLRWLSALPANTTLCGPTTA